MFVGKVDVHKGALPFKRKLIIGVLVCSKSCVHPLLSYDDSG
jgi:hypothetical protein